MTRICIPVCSATIAQLHHCFAYHSDFLCMCTFLSVFASRIVPTNVTGNTPLRLVFRAVSLHGAFDSVVPLEYVHFEQLLYSVLSSSLISFFSFCECTIYCLQMLLLKIDSTVLHEQVYLDNTSENLVTLTSLHLIVQCTCCLAASPCRFHYLTRACTLEFSPFEVYLNAELLCYSLNRW